MVASGNGRHRLFARVWSERPIVLIGDRHRCLRRRWNGNAVRANSPNSAAAPATVSGHSRSSYATGPATGLGRRIARRPQARRPAA